MRTEDEIRGRLEHWRSVLAGMLKGEETKKTIGHIIEQLEWVLGDGGQVHERPPTYWIWKQGEDYVDAYDLRDWLRDKLAGELQGVFLLGKAANTMKDKLPKGSKVLFSRAGKGQRYAQIVASATVKEGLKSRFRLGPDKKLTTVRPGEHPKLKNMVVFMPETVDAWDDDTFVSFPEVRDLGINIPKGRYPPYKEITADEFRKIVARHESKKQRLKFSRGSQTIKQ